MRLNWNEIRLRAHRFAEEWADAHYERGETQTFYNEFFQIFDVSRKRVAAYEHSLKLLGNKRGFIDLFWKGVLLIEQKSAGKDLITAKTQAFDYFPGLKDEELPRYILLSDFQNFELYDLEENTSIVFKLAELPQHIEAFGFILGIQKRIFRDQDPVNVKASELMGRLHDALKETGYEGHDLEQLLVRLVFCLFADDTGIFEPKEIFQTLIEERTRPDGSDLGPLLSHLFEVLNTERRQTNLDTDLAQFPYINGALFAEHIPIPAFDAKMRTLLLEVCAFKWDAISPAIFGALFQSVMDAKARRAKGAHYTTEKNILKVIQPLFLDELQAEFARLKMRRSTDRIKKLGEFHAYLGTLTFFDPACGCGNFLIITYRELRSLELELLKELHPDRRQLQLDVEGLSKIDVDQFYGIEIEEFPARIAEVALWMMDHIMNNRLSLEFGESYARIPLKKSPHIVCGDALETDWETVLPAARCSYVMGNPPFLGAKVQSEQQRAQVRRIANLPGSGGTLDFVTAWFLKAGAYVSEAPQTQISFVATNSITQGEQVAQLWPLLFDRCKLEIAFAHRTFAWGSDARGMAHVHVVIIGLVRRDIEPKVKRLFSYADIKGNPVESQHAFLTAYLFAGSVSNRHLVVREAKQALQDVPKIVFGSMPNDGGHLIISDSEYQSLRMSSPEIMHLIRPLIGAQDMLNGESRYCLWLRDATPNELRTNKFIQDRIAEVKKYRLASTREPTQKLALYPASFGEVRHIEEPFVIIPRHSSENREYVPLGFYDGFEIAHDSCLFVPNASLATFAILTSAMHMAWLRQIGGRLKSDYRYSIGLVYNTFPWPDITATQQEKLAALAQAVLDARAQYPDATLADLYDPDLMKPNLRKAHRTIDQAVDKLYRATPFTNDTERVEHLFGIYERMTVPLAASVQSSRRKASKSR